jgi:hypothetical protein
LRGEQSLARTSREVEHRVELVPPERVSFGSALDLDERAAVVHHDVHVGLCGRVLGVVEIDDGQAGDDANRHGRDLAVQRVCGHRAPRIQRGHGVDERDIRAVIRGRARAAIGLQHVAVERDRSFAERTQVDDRAQRAADQPLDLERATRLLAARRFAGRAAVRRARQHSVLRRDPAFTFPAQERGHAVVDARGDEHTRIAELDQHGAFRVPRESPRDAHASELIGRASARPQCSLSCGASLSQRTAAAVVLSANGAVV